MTVGQKTIVDTTHDVLAPSVDLEDGSQVGIVETNALQNNGGRLVSQAAFPAAVMPFMPLAPGSAGAGPDVTVLAHQKMSLNPGTYGALTIQSHGQLLLSPGIYFFTNVTMADYSFLVDTSGTVQVNVSGSVLVGQHAQILPYYPLQAGQLTITVGGTDTASGVPAVSIGENSLVQALLAATHGTVALADNVHVTGALAGFDINAGQNVHLNFQSGFPVNPPGSQGSQQLSGYYGVPSNPAIAPMIGPVPPDTTVFITVGLPVLNPQGLRQFIKQVSDPNDPNYRHYLSQSQFNATYGASATDYQAVQNWATSAGLTINSTYPNNLLMNVSGTAAQIEQALHTNLYYRLRKDGSNFIAVDRDPSLNLSVPILEIGGLTDFTLPHSSVTLNGTGKSGSYRAADLRNAYLGSSPCQNLDGTGQVIGIVGIANYDPNDIAAYDALQIPPRNPANVTPVFNQSCTWCGTASNGPVEAALDVEMVQAMAPGAIIRFYQAVGGATGHLDDVLAAMATSYQPLTVASCSLVFGRSDNAQQSLMQMAAQGVSFFSASGDAGDIGDPQGNQDMDFQTLVGGTFLNTNPLISPLPTPIYPINYYAGETTWNRHPGNANQSFGVTGGGIMDGQNKIPITWYLYGGCSCWPEPLCCGSGVLIPDYQKGVNMTSNGGSIKWRNYPDVAMLADDIEIIFNGEHTVEGGTSAAAPLWAGFTALANQAAHQNGFPPAGFLNTTIYDIGLTSGSNTDLYSISFHDINDGGTNANGFGSGFTTVQGYDLTTGWGSPTCGLIQQVSTVTPLTPNQPLDIIRFVFSTGDDNLRGNGGFGSGCNGTGLTVDVLLQDGTSFSETLKPTSTGEEWANYTTTSPIDFAIPSGVTLTQSHGIKGITLTIHESYSFPCTADNWDVTEIDVSLFNPPSPPNAQVCQLKLTDNATLQDKSTGLIRFSENPGGSGVGRTATFLVTDSRNHCP